MKFTTVTAVDKRYYPFLRTTYPSWRRCPAIMGNPLIVLYDCDEIDEEDLDFIDHPECGRFAWPMSMCPEYESQREKMLTAFLTVPMFVTTPYWLKVDADAACLGGNAFPREEWFHGDPAWIASGWGYSKPADTVQRLDDWGDTVPQLQRFDRLNIAFNPMDQKVRHPRMASWLAFFQTQFSQQVMDLCDLPRSRPPLPTQDGLTWYVAERMKLRTRTVKMKNHGWTNSISVDKLQRLIEESADV